MSDAMSQAVVADPDRLQRRVVALGTAALEGERELGDVLGEAFRELRAALASIRALQGEVDRKDAALSALRAELEANVGGRGAGRIVPRVFPAVEGNGGAPPARSALDRPDPPAREPLDPLHGSVPEESSALAAFLRERIAGAVHCGTLAAGDRLPSIREVARRTGLNHKTIRRIYRALERDGLVEVRDRSGIYVAAAESPLGAGLPEVEGWVASLVAEAGERGIRAGDLPSLLECSLGTRPLRCACVDSTEDDRFALCHEIEERFGMETVPVAIGSGDWAARLGGADLVVTTPYHAAEVRRALAPGQPLVVAALHPRVPEALRRAAEEGSCTIACVDAASGKRLRHGLGPELAARVAVVSVDGAGARGARSGGGVATLAARERLDDRALSVPPYLAPRAAQEIAALLVRMNRMSD